MLVKDFFTWIEEAWHRDGSPLKDLNISNLNWTTTLGHFALVKPSFSQQFNSILHRGINEIRRLPF
eukprot:5129801-Lingulodinium_polyedra.AAC.1